MSKKSGALQRGLAVIGIVSNVYGVPVTKEGTPDLVRLHAKHSKEVRLQEIRREISRNTIKPFTPTPVLDKRTAKKLRKP